MREPSPPRQSTPPSTSTRNNEGLELPTNYGRPLSIIESITSGTDEEDRQSDATENSHFTSDFPLDASQARSDDLKTQINELLQIRHTLAHETSAEGSQDGEHYDKTLLKDLPNLLAEYEKAKGEALLHEEARPVLDIYVNSNPDLVMEPDALYAMITMLNNSRNDSQDEHAEVDSGLNTIEEREGWKGGRNDERRRGSSASTSGSDMSLSTEEEGSQSETNREEANEKNPSALSHRHFDFPRSQSERGQLSVGGKGASHDAAYNSLVQPRKKTTSDPMEPSAQPRRASKGRRERRQSGEIVDKDVLRGKGKAKAPPSAWPNGRPKPPALAKRDRNRRISDISSNQSDYFDHEDLSPLPTSASYQSQLGMGTPSSAPTSRPPRQRQSSHPELRNQTSTEQVPRSISSSATSFVFPRARQSLSEEPLETYGDSWIHMSQDGNSSPIPKSGSVASIPRSSSSRAASPGLDEASYHNFSVISPTFNGDYFGASSSPPVDIGRTSRRSSAAGRRRFIDGDEGDETMMAHDDDSAAIRTRLELAQRQLADKERQHDAVQQEHESYIAKLQEELEESKAMVSAKKREEKESRIRENGHMDTIASLEADLNKTEKMLQITKDHLANYKNDYEDQVAESERLRMKMSELQEELERLRGEEKMHSDNARMWDIDRNGYREKVRELHLKIDDIEGEASKMQEGERENRVLKEQLERLSVELEEVRRGSSMLGPRGKGTESENGTMSKRLGSELAKQLANSPRFHEEELDEIKDGEDEEGDQSVDSVHLRLVHHSRKARKSKGEDQGDTTSNAPPTYDEAALEKQFSDRLHPPFEEDKGTEVEKRTEGEGEAKEVHVLDPAYLKATKKTGIRCTVLEDKLKEYESTHPGETGEKEDGLSTVPDSLSSRLHQATENLFTPVQQLLVRIPSTPLQKRIIMAIEDKQTREDTFLLGYLALSFALGMLIFALLYPFFTSPGRSKSLHELEDWYTTDSLSPMLGSAQELQDHFIQRAWVTWTYWSRSSLPGRVAT